MVTNNRNVIAVKEDGEAKNGEAEVTAKELTEFDLDAFLADGVKDVDVSDFDVKDVEPKAAKPKTSKSKAVKDGEAKDGEPQQSEQSDRPEPFASVLDLIQEHGEAEIIQALLENAEFDAQDEERCLCCRLMSAALHRALRGVIRSMAQAEETIPELVNTAQID